MYLKYRQKYINKSRTKQLNFSQMQDKNNDNQYKFY